MAFELTKAKIEAKRARREAIVYIDKYINACAAELQSIKEPEERSKLIDEMTRLVAMKEVYKKATELPKWATEGLIYLGKIGVQAFTLFALKKTTYDGTGDKFTNMFFRDVSNA